MRHHRFSLGMLILLALPLSGRAETDVVTGDLWGAFQPIMQRVGSGFVDLLPNLDSSIDLWYHDPETTADKKVLGPAANGFVLHANSASNLASFKPSQHPFDWKGYPEKEHHPWSAEFHIFSVGRGEWLIISIWCGPSTDRALVRELLVATAKSAEETRKYLER